MNRLLRGAIVVLVALSLVSCHIRGGLAPKVMQGPRVGETERAVRILDNPNADEREASFVDATRLAYSSNLSGNGGIYVFDLTRGTEVGETLLTGSRSAEASPSFSNDGAFYYCSYRLGQSQIFKSSSESKAKTEMIVSRNQGEDRWPSVSSDGKRLVYSSTSGNGHQFFLWTLDLETGQNTIWCHGQQGAWHPQGNQIVYCRYEKGNWGLWILELDTGNRRRLTSGPASAFNPRFSPNGEKIAFTSNLGGDSNIWVMNADASGRVQITRNPAVDCEPVWSPQGDAIYFSSNRGGTYGIYRVDLDE